MSSPDVASAVTADPSSDALVEIGRYPSVATGAEHGLVVLAMGQPYWLEPTEGDFVLRVEPTGAAALREQLDRYDRECQSWPSPTPVVVDRIRGGDFFLALLWAGSVVGAYWAQEQWPRVFAAGALDATAIMERGEWWRAGTAAFLHADVAHLTGNLVSGIFAFAALTATVGRLRGWLLLLVATVAGNLLSVLAHYPAPYRSVGASTAIFAALGLLTGHAVRAAKRPTAFRSWKAVLVPLGAGITALALYGVGEQRVDFVAHCCGFATGLAAGLGASRRQATAIGPSAATAPS